MNEKSSRFRVSDIVLLALCVLFLLGILFLFGPCGPKEDGGWMVCHWAGRAVTGLAAVLTVIAVLHLAVRNEKTKQGLSLAVIPVALLAAATPGGLIGLCMMHGMRCHQVMRPAVLVFSVLILIVAAFDAVRPGKGGRGT